MSVIFRNLVDMSSVPSPASGYVVAYDLDGVLKQKDSLGIILEVGGGTVSGSTNSVPLLGTTASSPLTGNIEFNPPANFKTALSSSTRRFYIGAGDNRDLALASTSSKIEFIPTTGVMNLTSVTVNGQSSISLSTNYLSSYTEDSVTGSFSSIAQTCNDITINATDASFMMYVPNVTMGLNGVIKSATGGGQINLDYSGVPGEVLISTDNGGYSKSQLYLAETFVELSNYNTGGVLYTYAPKSIMVSDEGAILMGDPAPLLLSTTNYIHLEPNSIGFDNRWSISHSRKISIGIKEYTFGPSIEIIANSTQSVSTSGAVGNGTFINTDSSTILQGVLNSVIIGGGNIVADTNNTVYVPNLVTGTSGVIRSNPLGYSQIELDSGGQLGKVIITNDGGAFASETIWMEDEYLGFFTRASTAYIEMDLVLNNRTIIYNSCTNSNIVIGVGGNDDDIFIADNTNTSATSSVFDKNAIIIGSKGSSFAMGVTNSVIIGGASMSATQSNTVYVPDLNISGTVNGVKKYAATLIQVGTASPTAKVLENTFGGTLVWSYFSIGRYRATLSGAFTTDKTIILLGHSDSSSQMSAYWVDTSTIEVNTGNFTAALANDFLYDSGIEIRVYP